MRKTEIRAVYMRMIHNKIDNVSSMHQLISKTDISPLVKIGLLSASLSLLNDVRDLYMEMVSVLGYGDTTAHNGELRAIYTRIVGDLIGDANSMHTFVARTKIEPRLKVKVLATSLSALTEVQCIYQEMIDALEQTGSK